MLTSCRMRLRTSRRVSEVGLDGGDKEGMTSLGVGLKRGRNGLKGEVKEVMTS